MENRTAVTFKNVTAEIMLNISLCVDVAVSGKLRNFLMSDCNWKEESEGLCTYGGQCKVAINSDVWELQRSR